MKSKILKYIFLTIIYFPVLGFSQYIETFGNPLTSSVSVSSYTGYSATGVFYSGGYYGVGVVCNFDSTPKINKNDPVYSYYGATTCMLPSSSRQGYLVLPYSNTCAFGFNISNINTLNYSNLTLSFNARRSTETGLNPYLLTLKIEFSTNSTDGNNGSWTTINLNNFTTTWTPYTFSTPIPSSASLSLRFRYGDNPSCPSGSCSQTLISIDDIKITGTLGLTDNLPNEKISIYPNPAYDKFIVDFGNKMFSNYTIKINNLLGQEVFSSVIDKPQFYISKVWQGEGIYLVNILDEQNEVVCIKKIVLL